MNKYDVTPILLSEIHYDDTFNCRGAIAVSDVIDLAKDIKAKGLDVPIHVQPWSSAAGKKYRIVAGHRRYKAFVYNAYVDKTDKPTIPCFVTGQLDETAARQMNLRENLHRQNLNMLQEANALKYFLDLKGGMGRYLFTDDELAQMFGQSRGWVQNRRDLLKLPVEIQKAAASGVLTQEQIKKMAKMKNSRDQFELLHRIKDAKQRGEKVDLTPSVQRASDVGKTRARKGVEITEMAGLIYDMVGPNVITRFAAWATGVISTVDLMKDVQKFCLDMGIEYKAPNFLKAALSGATDVLVPSASGADHHSV